MNLSDLDFSYPEQLIATSPVRPSRVMWVDLDGDQPQELTLEELLCRFQKGDLLVINDTKVTKRRVMGQTQTRSGRSIEIEVLFVEPTNSLSSSSDGPMTSESQIWKILCPIRHLDHKKQRIVLPEGVELEVVERGIPQLARLSQALSEPYFQRHGEMPLPPYIQRLRGKSKKESHGDRTDSGETSTSTRDETWYQSAWARSSGSSAAPTASLHFTKTHLETLKNAGVLVETITLHVGLGTYLPIKCEDMNQHNMHAEPVLVKALVWDQIQSVKKSGGRVWALGTTVTRALESVAQGLLPLNAEGDFEGTSNLFIKDGFNFQIVDRLMTNFHQPQTTLLALVCAFAGLENVKSSYQWAVTQKFRLFSYGDLSIWSRKNYSAVLFFSNLLL